MLRYLVWHYGSGFRSFLKAEQNFFAFGWYFFSISELLRTLFSPWHQILEKKKGGIASSEFWQSLSLNLMSRVLGAMVRAITIMFGLVFEAALLLILCALTIIWLAALLLIPTAYVSGVLLLIISS